MATEASNSKELVITSGKKINEAHIDVLDQFLKSLQKSFKEAFEDFMTKGKFVAEDKTLSFKHKIHGAKPLEGYALFIGLHDNCEAEGTPTIFNENEVSNDDLWNYMFEMYTVPQGAIWLVLRSPLDQLFLWRNLSVMKLIKNFIRQLLMTGAINYNKVYLVGEGMGGGIACVLGSTLAYIFAGVIIFSGCDFIVLVNTQHVPFYFDGVEGEIDSEKVLSLCSYKTQFKLLKEKQPSAYKHEFAKLSFLNNYMDQRLRVLESFALKKRCPLPQQIVWYQDHLLLTTHFYWLAVQPKYLITDTLIIGLHTAPNEFKIYAQKIPEVIVRFNKYMGDLGKIFKIYFNGFLKFKRFLDIKDMTSITYQESGDPYLVFSHEQTVSETQPSIIES